MLYTKIYQKNILSPLCCVTTILFFLIIGPCTCAIVFLLFFAICYQEWDILSKLFLVNYSKIRSVDSLELLKCNLGCKSGYVCSFQHT